MSKTKRKDPLIIPVPSGATEINLRPIILPIIQAIIHAKDRYNFRAVTVKQAEDWLNVAVRDSAWWRRVEGFRVMWFKPYLEANGWRRHNEWDKEKLSFEKRKKRPDQHASHWEQFHHIDLREDAHDQFLSNIRIIETIMASEEIRDPNTVIDAVLECAEPLDRLAAEGGEDV